MTGMKTFNIDGKDYPARFVMGAMLLYKRETGKEVSELKQDDVEGMLWLMWCCIKCACQAEKVDFPYDFETFCNSITPQDVEAWNRQMADDGKKKVTETPARKK